MDEQRPSYMLQSAKMTTLMRKAAFGLGIAALVPVLAVMVAASPIVKLFSKNLIQEEEMLLNEQFEVETDAENSLS